LGGLGAEPSEATRAIIAGSAAIATATCDPDALAALRDAFAASREHLVVVFVRGPRGSGKSALFETFVDEVRRTTDAVVLAAVDSEREQTPMPAVDQAIDQLSTYLLGLPSREADDLLAEAAPLARVFPALRRIPRLQLPVLPHGAASSPAEIFREGVKSLRRVVSRIAACRPLVFAVDNGRGPGPELAGPMVAGFTAGDASSQPRVLLFMVIRPDALPGNALIANFVRWRDAQGGDVRFIDLGDRVG
ncbi:MAG: ATP-binding protein, partial [Deltaproteobacteria bacterium]|nr:ATP-binding protein [Kofleriaceae bacterium]